MWRDDGRRTTDDGDDDSRLGSNLKPSRALRPPSWGRLHIGLMEATTDATILRDVMRHKTAVEAAFNKLHQDWKGVEGGRRGTGWRGWTGDGGLDGRG